MTRPGKCWCHSIPITFFWVPKNGAPPRLGSESLPPTMVSAFLEPFHTGISTEMRGCCWDGQRLSSPEMESLVQNRIPKGIADFCHKIPQNRKSKQQQQKTRKWKRSQDISSICSISMSYMSSLMYIKMVPTRISTFLEFFQLGRVSGQFQGQFLISYCLVTKKLSTAWNVIIPNNPQYLFIYIYYTYQIIIR